MTITAYFILFAWVGISVSEGYRHSFLVTKLQISYFLLVFSLSFKENESYDYISRTAIKIRMNFITFDVTERWKLQFYYHRLTLLQKHTKRGPRRFRSTFDPHNKVPKNQS
jgi:hypothetical protein